MKLIYWIYFVLMIATMVTIFIFSSQTGTKSKQLSEKVAVTINVDKEDTHVEKSTYPILLGFSLRKYAHIILYAVLGSVIICYAYAVSDEVHQLFVSDRGACFRDTCVDAIGFLTMMVVIRLVLVVYQHLKPNHI